MARPLRLDQAGAYYHVFSRGIERRIIFSQDEDREDFLDRLKDLPGRFSVEVHAYVLMDNHYHLLLRPENLNLSQAVQWLNVGFSIWFNKRHRRVGPLFQGRFKSVLIGEEKQLSEITRYLHLNPIRIREFGLDFKSRKKLEKGMGKALADESVRNALRHLNSYRWSSYRFYAGWAARPTWLQTSLRRSMSAKDYRHYIEQAIRFGLLESPFRENLIEGFLGSREQFEKLRKNLKVLNGNRYEQKGLRQLEGMLEWDRIVRAVESMEGMSWGKLCLIRGNSGRDLALVLGRRHGGLSLRELGKRSGEMSYAAVAQAVKRAEDRAEKDESIRRKITELIEMLNVNGLLLKERIPS